MKILVQKRKMETTKHYLFIILYWMLIYFQPVGPFLLLVGFFVTMDTISGMAAAVKNHETLTSKKFREIFPKFIVYGVAVLVSHVLQKEFFPDFPALKIVAGYVAYSELMSIDENIQKITGVSMFKTLIKKLKK